MVAVSLKSEKCAEAGMSGSKKKRTQLAMAYSFIDKYF
jgi:hypothetical protein